MENPVIYLQNLLNEFYATSSNARKQEIEQQLKIFQNTPNSWELCLHTLPNFNNINLWFFSVSSLEVLVTRKWLTLSAHDRLQIREFIWQLYYGFPLNVGNLQRDKIAQLIALIGKREFPETHSEYVSQITELIKNKCILGIALLKATNSECIMNSKPDVSSHQKKMFLDCMTVCLPQIIPLLNKFLTLCVCTVYNNELIDETNVNINLSLPNDNRFSHTCTELLSCVQQIFSWAPAQCLDSIVTSEFFNNIFELCTWNENYLDVNLAALSTISELFYLQKKIPFQNCIANGITELIQQKTLLDANEQYQDKLTELLRLFTTQQWKTWINDNCFPAKEFLLYLFNYTFSGISLTFTERLAIWVPIIASFKEKGVGRYTETTLQLVSNIYKKMQFQYEQNELDLLDTEELDENMETDLQHFLNQCLDVIGLAAEVEPIKIFDLFMSEFNREDGQFKLFISLLNSLPNYSKDLDKSTNSIDDLLNCFNTQSAKHLYFHYLLRDLSTMVQIMTRLSSVVLLMNTTEINERDESLTIVIKSILFAIKLANMKKIYHYGPDNGQVLNDYIEVHAQMLTSARSLVLIKEDVRNNYEEIYELIDSVTQLLLPSKYAGHDDPLIIRQSAAQLLLTITIEIRPNYCLKNPHIVELMHSGLHHLDKNIQSSAKRIIFNALLLPFGGVATNNTEEQQYEKRSALLQQYVNFMSNKFLHINVAHLPSDLKAVISVIKHELNELESLLLYYEEAHTITRQMLFMAIKAIIEKSIEIFNLLGKSNNEVYEMIVNFYLSVIKVLQQQLGTQFVIQIIKMFLEAAIGCELTTQSLRAMDKLLQMMLFIVQQSTSTTNLLMPDILKLAVDHALPLVFQHEQKNVIEFDIAVTLYSLLDAILQYRWNYFQKPIRSSGQVTISDHSQDQLVKIFTAYGRILVSPQQFDPTVVRTVLNSLEKLNQTCKLYDKNFFKLHLLKSFLCTLIRMLITPESSLHYELIVTALFNMSQSEKTVLHEAFIEVGYPSDAKIIQQICEATDSPTFFSYLDQLVQDTRFSQFLQ